MRIFKVRGMSCGHCVRAVTQALQARDPQARVQVDLGTGEVRVEGRRSRKAEDPRVGRVDPVPEEALGHVDELEAVPCRGGRDDSFSGSSQSRV